MPFGPEDVVDLDSGARRDRALHLSDPVAFPVDREDDRRGGVLRIEGADVRPEALPRAAVGDMRQDRVAVGGVDANAGDEHPHRRYGRRRIEAAGHDEVRDAPAGLFVELDAPGRVGRAERVHHDVVEGAGLARRELEVDHGRRGRAGREEAPVGRLDLQERGIRRVEDAHVRKERGRTDDRGHRGDRDAVLRGSADRDREQECERGKRLHVGRGDSSIRSRLERPDKNFPRIRRAGATEPQPLRAR